MYVARKEADRRKMKSGFKNLLVIVACVAVVVFVLLSEHMEGNEKGMDEAGKGVKTAGQQEALPGEVQDGEEHQWIDETYYPENASDTYSDPEWDMEGMGNGSIGSGLVIINPEILPGRSRAEIQVLELMLQSSLRREGHSGAEWLEINPESYEETESGLLWEGTTDTGVAVAVEESKEDGQVEIEVK